MSKSKITTIVLLSMTVILMVAIFVIGFIITRPTEVPSPVAPGKTKAQSITYNRTIGFSTVTPTTVPTLIISVSPSPTEIILARISPTTFPSATIALTRETTASGTISPTRTSSLPATGTVTNALFIFAAAGLMIFFSFLF